MKRNVKLSLVGPEEGGPTVEDLAALAKELTGREPTKEELEEAKRVLDKGRQA